MAELLLSKSLELQPLATSVLTSNCEVLNAANPEAFSHVLAAGGADDALRSDCDEQLLLTVPFMTPVKLHTLQFAAQEGAWLGSPGRAAVFPGGHSCARTRIRIDASSVPTLTLPAAHRRTSHRPCPPRAADRRLPKDAQALREPDVDDV